MKNIAIKLTNRCNQHCKHCYDYISHHRQPDMDKKTLDKVIDYIINLANNEKNEIFFVTLIGGEISLLDKQLLLYTLQKLNVVNNIKCMISTNLIYKVTSDWINIFKYSKNPTTDQSTITTSWDYNIRFKNNTEELLFMDNIDIISKNNIAISISVCLTSLLINNISPYYIFKKFSKYKINKILFDRIVLVGNAVNNKFLIPTNKDVDIWLSKAYLAGKEYNISSELFDDMEQFIIYNMRIKMCNLLHDEIVINTDGSLSFLKNSSNVVYGNVFDGIDAELYNNNVKCQKKINSKCLLCQYYKTLCNGICKFHMFDESGCPGNIQLIKTIQNYNRI